jgi:hypothetical protein
MYFNASGTLKCKLCSVGNGLESVVEQLKKNAFVEVLKQYPDIKKRHDLIYK